MNSWSCVAVWIPLEEWRHVHGEVGTEDPKAGPDPTKNLTKRLKRAPRPRPATDLEAQE